MKKDREMLQVISEFEQLGETLAEQSTALAQYYKALMDNGFSSNQAFVLVRDWHQQWLAESLTPTEEGDWEFE